MKTLDRRERVLLLLLVGLLLFVGVYYSSTLLSGGQAALRTVGLLGDRSSPQQAPESLGNPDSVRDSVLDRYRRTLPDFFGGAKLVSAVDRNGWTGTFEIALETDGQSWNGTFQGEVFSDGLVQGTLSSETSGSDSWVFQSREGSLYLHNRNSKKYRLGTVRFREPSPFQLDLDDLEEASLENARSTQWRGHDVYELNLQSERGAGRLFITRKEPRRLLEFDWTSDSDWSRQFDYSDDDPERLLAIRTYRDQNLVSSFRRTSSDTRILEYRSRRERTPVELVRLRYTPTGEDLTLRMDVYRRMGEDPILEASGTLRTANDRLDEMNVEADGTGWPDSGSSFRLNVQGSNLTSADTIAGRTLTAPQTYDEIEAGTFVRNLLSGRSGKKQVDTTTSAPSQTDTKSFSTENDTELARTPPRSRTEVRSETGAILSDEPEREDTAGQQQTPTVNLPEAPDRSGETVVRSSEDGYPSATPPAGFKEAQRFYENGKLDQAARTLDALADTFPESINVQFLLGVVEYERGRWKESEEHFRKVLALRHDPQLREWSRAYLRIAPDRDGQP